MPGWLIILLQVFNLLGSSGMVAMATYGQTNSVEGAAVAGVGAVVQQLRDNPLSKKTLEAKKD